MTLLDRYILRSLAFNYCVALIIMISLYMLLDLFFNIDEFTETDETISAVIAGVGGYYGAHLFLYFSQLSGVITLFACMTTLARMRKANELTAMLASGVSLYRVAVPVMGFGLATSLFWYVDTEWIIPRVAHRLARSHEDAAGTKARGVWFVKDLDGSLLSALEFIPADAEMKRLLVLRRAKDGSAESILEAEKANWVPIPAHPNGGLWKLVRGVERFRRVSEADLGPRDRVEAVPVDRFESSLSPEEIEVRQAQQWLNYTSAGKLSELAERDPTILPRIRQIQHGRFATPLIHLLMLLLGLPFFLSREPANILTDAGKCLAVCGLCFFLAAVGENFVVTQRLSALPSWLPLIVFAPVAVVMIDRVRT